MNKPKGTKPNDGYSLENPKGPAKPVTKSSNDASGLGSTYGISTAKISALGQEIDVVRTTNGHYVSRKMIEQLRAQNLANQQKQAPIPTPAKVVSDLPQPPIYTNPVREANNQYISARPKPGGFDDCSQPAQARIPRATPPGDTYGHEKDQYSDTGFYNADNYYQGHSSKQPRKKDDFHQQSANKMRDEPFTETNKYYSRPNYDRGSDIADPYAQPQEYPQDTRKLDNPNKAPKKKGAKDKDQAKAAKQKTENSEQKAREAKRGFQDFHNEQLVEEPNRDLYGSYGADGSQYGQQTWYGQDSSGYYNGQPIDDQNYYSEYQEQYVQDQYPQHESDANAQNFAEPSNQTNERSANPKADKKQPFANKNSTSKDQMAPSFSQRPDDYPAKQNLMEKDTKRMDPQRPHGASNTNNLASQKLHTQKPLGGSPPMGPKSLNVNSPPVDFDIIQKSLQTENSSYLPADSKKLQVETSSYSRGQGQKNSKDQANPQKQPAVSKEDTHDPTLLAEISSIVKCIKRYEDSCKELEQIYLKQGIELRTQLNYDYATFSRNCLNIVRGLLNEITAKDRPKEKEIQIKKQIEKLKATINENQAQVNLLTNLASKNQMETIPGTLLSKGLGDQSNDVAQISSIIPASITSTLMMNPLMQLRSPTMMGHNVAGVQLGGVYPGQLPVHQPNALVQSEIIKKNLQSGAYGSFIMNPYLMQQQAQATPSYGFTSQPIAYQTAEPFNQYNNDFSYGGLYAPQTQVQPEVYNSLPVANSMPIQMDLYGAQQGLSFFPGGEDQSYPELSQPHGTSVAMASPVTDTTTESFKAEIVDPPLDIEESLPSDLVYPPLGSDLRLYGVGSGLFGTFSKVSSKAVSQNPASATEKKGKAASQENYKSMFSLFTQPSKAGPVVVRQGMSHEDDDSSSHGNLKLYSDEDEVEAEAANHEPADSDPTERAYQLPKSLEQLLDDDSGGDAKSDSKKQDYHLLIDDISDIIPTENRFIQDSHLNTGRDFTLVDDGKQEDAHANLPIDSNHQFIKNGGTNEGSLVQSRKESQHEQIGLLHPSDDEKSDDQQRLADPQPGSIIAGDLSASKESDDHPSLRKASSTDQKLSVGHPQNDGDHSSSSKHDLVRDEQPNKFQGKKDQVQPISESNLAQDSPVPTESDTIISPQQTASEFVSNKTSTATPIIKRATQERSSDGQTPTLHQQISISSQQVIPAQQGVFANENLVCSTSNNIKSDSNLKGETSLGQNRDLRVTDDQDLAVPNGDDSHTATRAGDRNPEKRLPKTGKSIRDTSAMALSEGRDSLGLSSDLKRELPRETIPTTFLSNQQVMRLIDIGKRASNKISVLVSKILDGYADSKSRRKEKRSEDSFFTESENPHGLNIFELCTSSEYSACVQRKLSRLKETERIELFYLMKPHLIRLLMDGLGKYVVHGMMSMSKPN